ncbi:MAG: ATP-grasp domain-containing protein [Clostridia bacterium]|nr:ATP-grasp domain-containing protein [Clostridia bacterium]
MKKLLIIGAGFLQTYVIKHAKKLGYYTLAVDGNESALGFKYADEYAHINIVDKDACLSYAKDKQIDGVLTAATDFGVLTASYIAKKMKINGIDYSVAQTVKNKYSIRKTLLEAHADDTEQAYEISCDEDVEKVKRIIRFPVMVKPCDGSGSRGANRVDRAEDFAEACKIAMGCSLAHKALVESFIVGKEYGVESFIYDGKVHVLAVMRKWMTEAPYYAELGHSIPCCLDRETEHHIRECVEKAIRSLKIDFGSVNIDLLLSEDGGVHIVDIGARMGGNLIGSNLVPTGTGIDYMGAMIKAAVGDKPDLSPQNGVKCIVTRLLALTPGVVKALPDFERIEKEVGVEIHHHMSVGEEIREYHTNLDGCGYVVSVADDYETALRNAELGLSRIDREIIRE